MFPSQSIHNRMPHNRGVSQEFETGLNHWVSARNIGQEQRSAAAARIRSAASQSGNFLNLSGMQLTSLPSCISELSWITEINLASNKFTQLPDLTWARHLTRIDLSENWIGDIDNICGFVSLQSVNCSLSLQDNSISTLPAIDGRCPFATLNLRQNNISTIDLNIIQFGTCDINLQDNLINIDESIELVFETIRTRLLAYQDTPTLTLSGDNGVFTVEPLSFNQLNSFGSGTERSGSGESVRSNSENERTSEFVTLSWNGST